MRNKLVSVVGVNPPADIASGRIAEAFLNQHIQNHHPITVLVYKVVVYVFVLHFSRERKEFVLRVLSLKMYISYNTNVRKLCPISNKFIKKIKSL